MSMMVLLANAPACLYEQLSFKNGKMLVNDAGNSI